MDCPDFRDDLLELLYEEATPEARRRLEQHMEACAACRDELRALRALRGQLQAWRVPVVGAPTTGRGRAVPRAAWRLAWAAGLILALGAGIRLSGVSFELRRGPLTIQLGGPSTGAIEAALARRLAEQDARHRQEVEALRASLLQRPAPDESARLAESVRDLIREAEARQADAIESRLASFEDRVEARRRYDLARISTGLSYLDGKAGRQAARTTELVSYVLQASQPQ
jgi:hypothetical protein